MSNVLGIISEYNPFHNGHLYHLNESKKLTNSDYSIAIITGNFTQRGDVSIVNKWSKTRIQRILLYSILGITKKEMHTSKLTLPYIRALGFNDKGRDLISEISNRNPKLEIVTSPKKFLDKNPNKNLRMMIEKDIWATNVYTLGYEYESKANLDFTEKLITY